MYFEIPTYIACHEGAELAMVTLNFRQVHYKAREVARIDKTNTVNTLVKISP